MSTIPLDLGTDAVILAPPALSPQVSLHQALTGRRRTRAFLTGTLPLEERLFLAGADLGCIAQNTTKTPESRCAKPSTT